MGLFFSRLALALTALMGQASGASPSTTWQPPGGAFWETPGGTGFWELPG